MSKGKYIAHTSEWISTFVIGFNLCPFAALPFKQNRIKYVVEEGEDFSELMELVFNECVALQMADESEVETTIIIHPQLLTNFENYLEVFAQLEENLEKLNLHEQIQLASFHPDYQFAGTEYEDAENFTNRSPYPMVHILRANSVEKAINSHPNTEMIPVNNIQTMNKIGAEELIKQRNEIIRKN